MNNDAGTNDELMIVLTTVETVEQADRIGGRLIESSLAACVQVEGPITSHYVWEGRAHRDQEYRLVIKTTRAAWSRLSQWLATEHPYDEPQIVAVPVCGASDGYADWVRAQVRR